MWHFISPFWHGNVFIRAFYFVAFNCVTCFFLLIRNVFAVSPRYITLVSRGNLRFRFLTQKDIHPGESYVYIYYLEIQRNRFVCCTGIDPNSTRCLHTLGPKFSSQFCIYTKTHTHTLCWATTTSTLIQQYISCNRMRPNTNTFEHFALSPSTSYWNVWADWLIFTWEWHLFRHTLTKILQSFG